MKANNKFLKSLSFLALTFFLLISLKNISKASNERVLFTIDSLKCTVDLQPEGGAYVTENWKIAPLDEGLSSFSRFIPLDGDNFSKHASLSEIVVSLDGDILMEKESDVDAGNAYTVTKDSGGYLIDCRSISKSGTHEFSLRYFLSGAVKLYNERAYFYFRIIDNTGEILIHNASITINAPKNTFSEDFIIEESGSLACEKRDGQVEFLAPNIASPVKIGLSMPSSVFSKGSLTLIEDDDTGNKAAGIAFIAVILFFIALLIVYISNYKKRFRKKWIKKTMNVSSPNFSKTDADFALSRLSPMEILNMITDKPKSRADFFIATILDLLKRGYIKAGREGFSSSLKSEGDEYDRPLNKNEKRVIFLFSNDKWKKLLLFPQNFKEEIKTFNKKIRFPSPFYTMTKDGKRAVRGSFEMLRMSKEGGVYKPYEISEDFFGKKNLSVKDLIVSLAYESGKNKITFDTPDRDTYKHDIFMFRDILDKRS